MTDRFAKLGGYRVPLAKPRSSAIKYDFFAVPQLATGAISARVAAAALGVCWDGQKLITQAAQGGDADEIAKVNKIARPLSSRLDKYEFSINSYGGSVFDELANRGIDELEIMAAGTDALLWILDADDAITQAEVDKAEAFSEAHADSSSS